MKYISVQQNSTLHNGVITSVTNRRDHYGPAYLDSFFLSLLHSKQPYVICVQNSPHDNRDNPYGLCNEIISLGFGLYCRP